MSGFFFFLQTPCLRLNLINEEFRQNCFYENVRRHAAGIQNCYWMPFKNESWREKKHVRFVVKITLATFLCCIPCLTVFCRYTVVCPMTDVVVTQIQALIKWVELLAGKNVQAASSDRGAKRRESVFSWFSWRMSTNIFAMNFHSSYSIKLLCGY